MIPATSKQLDTLANLGYVGDPSLLDIKAASTAISELIAQRRQESDAAIQSFKASNSLESVVENLTKQQIIKHKIHCPLHSDGTPSMHIYDDGGFKCFQCGVHGDLLSFIGYFHFGPEYNPATHFTQVIDLIGGLNIAPQTRRIVAQEPVQKPKERLSITLEEIDSWHEKMPAERREYWHSRYLIDATIDRFALGWDGYRYTIPHLYRLVPFGVKRRLPPEVMEKKLAERAAAIGALKKEFPDLTEEEIEKIAPEKPLKYVTAKHTRPGIFNADILASTHQVIICEGEIDAMLFDQCGFPAVSPTAGAATWLPEWANLFSGVRRIWIIYDNDKAGVKGAQQVWSTLRRAKVVHYPQGINDCGDLFDQTGLNPIQWMDKTFK